MIELQTPKHQDSIHSKTTLKIRIKIEGQLGTSQHQTSDGRALNSGRVISDVNYGDKKSYSTKNAKGTSLPHSLHTSTL